MSMKFNFKSNTILENDRVRLEPLLEHHFSSLLPIALQHPRLLEYSPSFFGTAETLQNYLDTAIQQRIEQSRYPFVIYDKLTASYAGSTSYGNIFTYHQRLEIGWTWLGKKWQRTGLNRHCKFLLLSHAFDTLGVKRVELKTDDRNVQSKKAIQGIGAKYEGKLRSHTLMTDGHRRDTVYFSILAEEWEEVKMKIFSNISGV